MGLLSSRRPFGLNFERHVPESVQLPGRKIRRGDKVVFRDASGSDGQLWIVVGFEGEGADRSVELVRGAQCDVEDRRTVALKDLVVVAEFRDPIYPGLRSTGVVDGGEDKPYHTVINGENYHVLQALTSFVAGKVDCIYIDPPYNTGARDWKYNNDYVETEDAYRHSKWLAMMERRLATREGAAQIRRFRVDRDDRREGILASGPSASTDLPGCEDADGVRSDQREGHRANK